MIDSPEGLSGLRPYPDVARLGPPVRMTASAPPPLLVRRAVRALHELEKARERDRLSVFRALGLLPAADAPARDDGPDLRAGLLAQLRAATSMQVRALRARGEPPERMLCEMKAMFSEALSMEGWTHAPSVDPLMRRVVRWSIEAYYDR